MSLKDWWRRVSEFLLAEAQSAAPEPMEEAADDRVVTPGDSFGQRAKAAGVSDEVRRLYDNGVFLLAQAQWDKAAQEFSAFIEACPQMAADGYAGLARTARHLKGAAELNLPELLAQELTRAERELARAHYEAGIAAQPDHPHCCAGLAQMIEAEEPARALALLERACQSRPNAGVLAALGDAYVAAGRADDAVAAYQKALAATHDGGRGILKRLILLCEDSGRPAEAKHWRRELAKPRKHRRPWAFDRSDSRPMDATIDEQGVVRCPKCSKSFRLDDPEQWSGKRHLGCDQRLQFEGAKAPVHPVWCVVANIVGDHPHGEAGVVRSGTRLFRAGTKVHCFPPLWGDGYEHIAAIGLHRKSRRFITCVVSWRHLANWRARLVYEPHVVDQFRWHRAWDHSAGSKAMAEELVAVLLERAKAQ